MNKELKNMKSEELELLSYSEIAQIYLEETKMPSTTANLFKSICEVLELSNEEYHDKIADFFQSLSTSKNFILLEDGLWDLKNNHTTKIKIEDIDDDLDEPNIEEDDIIDEPATSEDNYDDDYDEEEDTDDEYRDLNIIAEEELED